MPFSFEGADASPAVEVWHQAFELGYNVINTADCYAPSAAEFGHNERLVGEAVSSAEMGREAITVITKNGLRRHEADWWRDNTPEYLVSAAERSAEQLGFVPDSILLHRLNREQSLPHAIEGLMQARERGFTTSIGVSNVNREELLVAWEASGHSLAFVENEQSPRYRFHRDVLELCDELGIVYLAWSPLGGAGEAARLGELHPEFASVAARHGVSAQQIALAWLQSLSPWVLPIPAFTRFATAQDSWSSLEIQLSAEDLELLNSREVGPSPTYPE